MGYEARANPRSLAGGKDERQVLMDRLKRFAAFFERREDYEAYLETAGVTSHERAFLETVLPYHLQVKTLH